MSTVVILTDLVVLTLAVPAANELRTLAIGPLNMFSAGSWVLLELPFLWLAILQRMGRYRPEYLNATGDAAPCRVLWKRRVWFPVPTRSEVWRR